MGGVDELLDEEQPETLKPSRSRPAAEYRDNFTGTSMQIFGAARAGAWRGGGLFSLNRQSEKFC
jgi:hypothetical protein